MLDYANFRKTPDPLLNPFPERKLLANGIALKYVSIMTKKEEEDSDYWPSVIYGEEQILNIVTSTEKSMITNII